jgi:hypothetical protein
MNNTSFEFISKEVLPSKKTQTRKILKENHIVEIINKSSYKIFDKEYDAIQYLQTLVANIRLDYHGVLDIIPKDIPLIIHDRDINSICAISFVGKSSPTRIDVRKDLMLRIKNNQIDFGILVFNRGKNKNKNTFDDIGSKAWVNKYLQCHSPKKCLFLDDSNEHIRSVQHLLGNDKIHSELFNTNNKIELIKKINEYAI